jgi:hypothetical protein
VSAAALAEDAVSIRRMRVRGVTETALRRQLATIPTPRVRRFVFVRRVTLRGAPVQIGLAMQAALTKLADNARDDVLSFADFPALAVACARAALGGGLSGWHWRTLGLPSAGTPGEVLAALLTAFPLEAGSAVAALAAHGLLAPVWRSLPDAAAAQLTASLAQAAGFAVPAWPDDAAFAGRAEPAALLERAATMWAAALAPLPPRSEAVRTAAVLALLRWAPGVLRAIDTPVWPALLARMTGADRRAAGAGPSRRGDEPEGASPRGAEPASAGLPSRRPAPPADPAAAALLPRPAAGDTDQAAAKPAPGPQAAAAARNTGSVTAAPDAVPARTGDPNPSALDASGAPQDVSPLEASPSHGQEIATGWGGVLFLINALRRLDVDTLLTAAGPAAPTGWRLLHTLGLAFGMPEDDPLAGFLAAQDLDTAVSAEQRAFLLDGIERLYRPDGPWPLPLAQPGQLRASETHLNLDLAATDIDIALRLSGLDFDPGWVPWLGRVVAFHYEEIPTFLRRGS